MAYTQTDLDSITAGIIALASGRRIASVTTLGRIVQYAITDIDKLRALKAEAESDVGSASGRRRFVLTSTSKGL
jgi:hypothetical protein